MKKCPRCQMTVNDNYECPYCHSSLTFEPQVPGLEEIIIRNKYYWIYKVKTCALSIICACYCLTLYLICFPPVTVSLLRIILSISISLVVSFNQKKFIAFLKLMFSESFSACIGIFIKYYFSFLSVWLTTIMCIIH